MVPGQPIKVLLVGAGKGGKALVDLFSRSPGVKIIGIADLNPDAPGLQRARQLNIPVTNDVVHLLSMEGTHLVIDVTGDPSMEDVIDKHKPPGVEVLGGTAARLLWSLVQHEIQLQSQLFHTDKLATIGAFSAGIAHDINNPLYLILSLTESLLDEKEPVVIRQYAQDILGTVRKIKAIVEGLTGYARPSAEGDPEPVEISRILDESLRVVKYATICYDVKVIKDYDDAQVFLHGRSEEFLQLFINLIKNAVQAMGGKGTLSLSVRNEQNTVIASVSDSGPGIPQEDCDRIFDPFFTTKPRSQGTGLGLYIVKTLLEKYGGEIRVETRLGYGTTFRLRFPKVRRD
ncbi:MAG: GHKL domain-containing protein [Nitrospirae bacterium]|nr:GHKL domain-containing protein [Nitrospirota bacterium]